MQHGTKKEEIQDILENSIAVLDGLKARRGTPVGDVIKSLIRANWLLDSLSDEIDVEATRMGFEP